MTGRRLAAWAPSFVLLQAAAWFSVVVPRGPWSGAWRKLVDDAAGSVVIVGPVLAGLVALAYARQRRTALPDLVASSVHPVLAWYRTAAEHWVLAVASTAFLVVSLWVVAVVQGVPTFGRPLLVLPYVALVLGVHVLIGMSFGLRLDARAAVPVAAVASFGLFLLAVADLAPVAFVTGGVSGSMVGGEYRPEALAQLMAIAVFCTVALVAVTTWMSGTTELARLRAGALAAGVVAAMVVSRQPLDLEERVEAVGVPLRCAGALPQVCVAAESPRVLPYAARRMHVLSKPLRDLRIPLPDRWVELEVAPPREQDGALWFGDNNELTTRATDEELLWSLSEPGTCPGFSADVPGDWIDAVPLVAGWLADRNDLRTFGVADPRIPTDDWVRTTYAQLRACDLDAIRLP